MARILKPLKQQQQQRQRVHLISSTRVLQPLKQQQQQYQHCYTWLNFLPAVLLGMRMLFKYPLSKKTKYSGTSITGLPEIQASIMVIHLSGIRISNQIKRTKNVWISRHRAVMIRLSKSEFSTRSFNSSWVRVLSWNSIFSSWVESLWKSSKITNKYMIISSKTRNYHVNHLIFEF